MNANQQPFSWSLFASRFGTVPLELKAFAIFSVAVTILDFSLTFLGGYLGPNSFPQQVVPITGWVPSMGYMFGIIFTFSLIYRTEPRWRWIRLGIVIFLLIKMLSDLYAYTIPRPASSDNPYLIISPWRPLWVFVLPAVWIVVLYSPRITKFCDARIEDLKQLRAANTEEASEPALPVRDAKKELRVNE